jgi:hypothetical protein
MVKVTKKKKTKTNAAKPCIFRALSPLAVVVDGPLTSAAPTLSAPRHRTVC